MANVKATDLIDFTRASKGHALAKVSYGEELVENGDFSSTDLSNWSSAINSTATVTSGELVVTGVSASGRQVAAISTTVGQVYKLSGEGRVSTGSGTALLAVSDTTSGLADRGFVTTTETTATDLQLIFVATQNTHYVTAGNGSSGTGDKTFDNISVKEVLFNQPDGTLQLFEHPNNIPRIEYDTDGNLLGLLIEESRTNLILNSSDFSAGSWTTQGASISAATNITAPDGTTNSFKLIESAGTAVHRVQGAPAAGGTTSTMSCFMKKAERSWGNINFSGLGNGQAWFDLENGVLGTVQSSVTARIEDYGNGWYRCSVTATPTSFAATDIKPANADDTTSYTGDGTSGIYVFGAQTEAGSFPTSYIKTTGSTASRSADVASIDVDQFGYNQSEGTLFAEYNPFSVSGTARGVFELSSGTGDDKMHSRASVDKHWLVRSGGVTQASIDLGSATEGQQNKIASVYNLNDFAASLNGSAVTTDTSGSVPTGIQELIIGSFFDGSNLNGHIKSITYTPKRLSNAKLQELTS